MVRLKARRFFKEERLRIVERAVRNKDTCPIFNLDVLILKTWRTAFRRRAPWETAESLQGSLSLAYLLLMLMLFTLCLLLMVSENEFSH